MSVIKTPDQRVRVFISSTINELADERLAAREAIENLRLIPVFFEAGARPHPPRDLYSAYLEQSHIFVGIYWSSYGWVAPGADISGLEDEYRLCGNKKPKLIYVKNSDKRQPELDALLQDIQNSDTACYQKFNTADELRTLLANDLSVLMSEIFETALFTQENKQNQKLDLDTTPVKKIILPAKRTEIVGREKDIENAVALLHSNKTHFLNILGAGGTGKTTLAIHLAHLLSNDFKDGVFFVPLAPVTDANLVASTIADTLELFDSGKQSMLKTLVDFLRDKQCLLVLDNYEQVVEAADVVNEILMKCTDVKIIVTSRSGLHIRGEYIYSLQPLSIPGDARIDSDDAFYTCPSVELFIARAKAVNSNLLLDTENKNAIASICNKLDGLPLAIELAASRTKMFQPAALVKRMDNMLELTSKGQRDLPERQQTLRNAIEWSYKLLDPESQKAFCMMGIFKRSWTLEAADAIINGSNNTTIDVEEVTEKLLDVSLVKPVLVSNASEPRFNMLQTVFEFAGEMLLKSEYYGQTSGKYVAYFMDLLEQSEGILYGMNGEAWLDKIEYEYQNIRAVFYILLANADYEKAWRLFELMVPYWIIRGGYTDVNMWIVAAGIESYDNASVMQSVSVKQKAATQTWAALAILMMIEIERGYTLLFAAEKHAEEAGDMRSLAYALIMDGCYGYFMQMEDSVEKIHRAEKLLPQFSDPFMHCMYLMWSYEYFRVEGKVDEMQNNLQKAHDLATEHGMTYILGSLYIVNYSLSILNGTIDYEKIYQDSMQLFNILPEKGYTGMKSAGMAGIAYCLMHLNRIDEAKPYMLKSLAYTRECGEKESEFYNVMEASQYYKITGNTEKACKLFGAVDNFIELAKYPIVGAAEVQYTDAKNTVYPDTTDAQKNKWYQEGRKMSLEDAIVYAMKETD